MPTITIAVPEKVTISENGTAQSESQQQPSTRELDTVLKAITPFAVWLVFLTIGGGLLALYYAKIGYLPDIEYTTVLVYLFIGTLVGGVIGLLLTISLLFPGFAWSRFIVFDPGIREQLSYSPSGNDKDKQLCIWSILSYLGYPFLAALLISHLALLLGKIWYWVIAIIVLFVTFHGMRRRFKWVLLPERFKSRALRRQRRSRFRKSRSRVKSAKEGGLRRQSRRLVGKKKLLNRQTFQYSFWFTLSVLLSQLSMYVIYWLSGSPGEWLSGRLRVFAILTVICTAACWISCHVVTMLYQHSARQAVAASLVAAGLLLFTADRFSSLSMKLMNRFGIGEDQYVNLLLTKQGAQKVLDLGLLAQPSCAPPRLCNVEIYSKVGSEYFLSVGGKTFTLPKSDVIAVQAEDRADRGL